MHDTKATTSAMEVKSGICEKGSGELKLYFIWCFTNLHLNIFQNRVKQYMRGTGGGPSIPQMEDGLAEILEAGASRKTQVPAFDSENVLQLELDSPRPVHELPDLE